jgi:hypothetical protein
MELTHHRRLSCLKLRKACGMLLILAATVIPAIAVEESDGGVVVRNSISVAYRDQLVRKLQAITGWQDLNFDRAGFLRTNPTKFRGGSASARELLRNALEGKGLIVLEGASSRSDVVFCRVDLGHWLQSKNAQPTTYVVLIDFNDFKHVTGDREARAAFDVGWAVLHELEHVVNYSEDTIVADGSGDCEAAINRMRMELGLPIRASYYFTLLPLKTDLHLISKFVRLPFDGRDPGSDKRKRYWLIWDAALVGGLSPSRQTASLQSSFRFRN